MEWVRKNCPTPRRNGMTPCTVSNSGAIRGRDRRELARSGLQTPEDRDRYQELSKRLAAIKHAGSDSIG